MNNLWADQRIWLGTGKTLNPVYSTHLGRLVEAWLFCSSHTSSFSRPFAQLLTALLPGCWFLLGWVHWGKWVQKHRYQFKDILSDWRVQRHPVEKGRGRPQGAWGSHSVKKAREYLHQTWSNNVCITPWTCMCISTHKHAHISNNPCICLCTHIYALVHTGTYPCTEHIHVYLYTHAHTT